VREVIAVDRRLESVDHRLALFVGEVHGRHADNVTQTWRCLPIDPDWVGSLNWPPRLPRPGVS
jgi:hypothetical protein